MPEHPAPERWLGPYRIVREIARGGQGAVLEAIRDQRRLALKLLLDPDPTAQQRFAREAQTLFALRHPALPRVIDLGHLDGRAYLAMDLIEGPSLHDHVTAQGPPAIDWAVDVVRQLAETLAYCHAQGVVHRDLKPRNVVLTAAGPVLVDFGLAQRDRGTIERLTLTGELLGTPAYMAPEQAEGDRGAVGPQSDVYALGGTLYFLLTGRDPFAGPTILNVLRAVLTEPPPDPRALRPETPPTLAALCQRALAKDPGERPPGAEAFAAELVPAPSAPRQPWPLVGLALGLIAAGGAAAAVIVSTRPATESRAGDPPAEAPGTPPTPHLTPSALPADVDQRPQLAERYRDAIALSEAYRFDEAIAILEEILRRDPELDAARQTLAFRLAHRGDHARALELLDHVDRRSGPTPDTSFLRGMTLGFRGDYAEGIRAMQLALTAPRFRLRCLVLAIDFMARFRTLDQADQVCDAALAEFADRPRPALEARRALIHLQRGALGPAFDLTSRLIARFPDRPDTYLVHAEVLIALSRFDEALEALDAYDALHAPTRSVVLSARAMALVGLDRSARAGELLREALAHYPRAPEPNASLAMWILQVGGDPREALRRADACLAALANPDPQTLLSRAYARRQLEDYDAAIEDYTAAIQARGGAHPIPLAGRGAARLELGLDHLDAAEADLTQALSLAPDDVDSRWHRALVYALQGKLEVALREVEQVRAAPARLPPSAVAGLALAAAQLRALLGQDARQAFARCAELAPDDAEAQAWAALHGVPDDGLRALAAGDGYDAQLARWALGALDSDALRAWITRDDPARRDHRLAMLTCLQGVRAEQANQPAAAASRYRAAAAGVGTRHPALLWARARLAALDGDERD